MNTADKTTAVGCVKAASSIIGDKWTPELLRFFLNEKVVRFCQLQDLVGEINPRTLSARLDMLEKQGIIAKHSTTSERRCEYTLTEKGEAFLPVLRQMDEWSRQYGQAV